MSVIRQLLENRILWIGVLSWFVAQTAKVVLTLIVEKHLDWSRMWGLGGMPSSHTSVVVSVTVAVGIRMGFNSALFAISAAMALITMTDAMGVRRQAGKQAAVLNRVVQELVENGGDLPEETLKELLGHTPLQVFVGGALGLIIAIIAARG
ncbi:MAG: divergent PAP2 family protein [Clostridia bacterium]|nr:divergent PAP2 family protein [Clostridia bacterium]MBO4886555.1 divergent PAP2 family protein [Clostridia bacterium]MBR4442186.1 divergent PAP2 family protein [Clostridia bacterium]